MPFSPEEQSDLPPCGIYVNPEGDWYHEGKEIIREDILDLFYENLHCTPEGEFIIEWRGKKCRLEAADTPFVISRVDRGQSRQGQDEIFLALRHVKNAEPLAPETLKVGKSNVLYCRIRNGGFPARFSRPAYYQLAEWIQEDSDSDRFYLELNGKRYNIETAPLPSVEEEGEQSG